MASLPKIFTTNQNGLNGLIERFFTSFPPKIEDEVSPSTGLVAVASPINFLHSQYLKDLLQNCLEVTEEAVVSKGSEVDLSSSQKFPVDLMKTVYATLFSMVNLQNEDAFKSFTFSSEEELTTVDVLSYFDITQRKYEGEVVKLSKFVLYNILNGRFFLFREPKEQEIVYIDSTTLLAHHVCNKLVDNSKTTGDQHPITSQMIEGKLVLITALFCVVVFDVSDIDLLREMEKLPFPSIFSLVLLSLLFLFSIFLTVQVFFKYKEYLLEHLGYTLNIEVRNGIVNTKSIEKITSLNPSIIKNLPSSNVYLIPKITENVIREFTIISNS